MKRFHPSSIAALAALCACQSGSEHRSLAAPPPAGPPPLTDDLAGFHRAITTRSPEAQRYFDQALVLTYAFNHDEAIACYREAARIDPDCAMAWWGIALASGPHINNATVDPARARTAWEALGEARARSADESALERGLIEALTARYSADPEAERKPLDEAYARAMIALSAAHTQDADVAALCAEALMNLQPWDLWTPQGEPKGEALDIARRLEAALALDPEHPLANHLYIHAMEGSTKPEIAAAAADRLRDLVPGAGHLVHMPAHIDIRTGRYAEACEANRRAIAADARHSARFPKDGFYRVYMAHNRHFLAFSAMMQGNRATALAAAREMVAEIPPEFLEANAVFADGLVPVVLHVLVRFGRWNEVLAEPAFPETFPVANAVRHYARGVSLTALDRLTEADAEARELTAAIGRVPADAMIGNNPAHAVLEIPELVLAGELAYRRGDEARAFELLREAAAIEDRLVYDEPPDWMMPVRHPLGAALVRSGRFAEAESVYLEDLKRFPDNGWSLLGLELALRGRGASAEAAEVHARFERAWRHADVVIEASCFCQAGPARDKSGL